MGRIFLHCRVRLYAGIVNFCRIFVIIFGFFDNFTLRSKQPFCGISTQFKIYFFFGVVLSRLCCHSCAISTFFFFFFFLINCWSSVVASVVLPQLCNIHFFWKIKIGLIRKGGMKAKNAIIIQHKKKSVAQGGGGDVSIGRILCDELSLFFKIALFFFTTSASPHTLHFYLPKKLGDLKQNIFEKKKKKKKVMCERKKRILCKMTVRYRHLKYNVLEIDFVAFFFCQNGGVPTPREDAFRVLEQYSPFTLICHPTECVQTSNGFFLKSP